MLGLGNSLTGGSALGWTPAEIPSLLHWYRKGVGQESDTGTSNTNCDLWTDQKGSNNLEANGGNDDLSPTLNGNGTITFDSSGDIMTFVEELALGTFSIYLKLSYTANIGGDYLMEKGTSDFFQLATDALVKIKIGGNGRHDYVIDPALPEDGTQFNIGVEREDTGGTTNDIVRVYSAGVSQTQSGGGDGIEVITELFAPQRLGKPTQTSTWHEIVICNDSLSSADRVLLNTYLDSL